VLKTFTRALHEHKVLLIIYGYHLLWQGQYSRMKEIGYLMNDQGHNDALRSNAEELTVDFINVGFGDSILIRQAWGEGCSFTALVDGGDQSSEDRVNHPQRIRTIEHLKNENIKAIDLLILTHFHRDHIADSLEIINTFPIKKVWLNCCIPESFLGQHLPTEPATNKVDSFNIFNRIITELTRRDVKIEVINQAESRKIGPMTIKALVPAPAVLTQLGKDIENIYLTTDVAERYQNVTAVDRDLNKTCLALKLEYQGWACLLTADLPTDFWPSCQADLGVNVLKAPHHGDIHSLSLELLKRTNPEYVVISADNQGTYGYPSPETDDLIVRFNPYIKILYTDVMPGVNRANTRFVRFRMENGTVSVTY
jgi:beta-lactamase superfamily II metal-dependent hydrolase